MSCTAAALAGSVPVHKPKHCEACGTDLRREATLQLMQTKMLLRLIAASRSHKPCIGQLIENIQVPGLFISVNGWLDEGMPQLHEDGPPTKLGPPAGAQPEEVQGDRSCRPPAWSFNPSGLLAIALSQPGAVKQHLVGAGAKAASGRLPRSCTPAGHPCRQTRRWIPTGAASVGAARWPACCACPVPGLGGLEPRGTPGQ